MLAVAFQLLPRMSTVEMAEQIAFLKQAVPGRTVGHTSNLTNCVLLIP